MRLLLAAMTTVILAGCNHEDARLAPVKQAMRLVSQSASRTGCEDRLFDNYPRFVECITQSMGATLKGEKGGEGASETTMSTLTPEHRPLEIEQSALVDRWPKDVRLWLGRPGSAWCVTVREDTAAKDVVIEGFGEDLGTPVATERVHVGR